MPLTANYHTHTVRCSHAVGEDREYAEAAFARGLKILGFSDHVTMPFPDGHESHFRIPRARLAEYVQSVLSLRERYAGRMEILLGFEAEYYPDLFPAMQALLSAYPVDYLILGQHFNDSRETPYNTRPQPERAALAAYVDQVLRALETGCFTYVAHPDLLNFTGAERDYRREARRLCEGAKALDVPLEINLLGFREKRTYPNALFWEEAAAVGNRVIIGCDAHDPAHVADPDNVAEGFAWAKRFGLTPMETIELRRPF